MELTLLPFNEEVSEHDRLVKAVARGENAMEIDAGPILGRVSQRTEIMECIRRS